MASCCRPAERAPRVIEANMGPEGNPYRDNTISNTKYSIITFLPKNFLEQFSRFMNMYFLMIACLQLWSFITPVAPITTWGPLAFIFTISAVKEGVDDYHRHVSDKEANNRLYTVVRDGEEGDLESCNICVGDIVRLTDDTEVPADMVLLKTSAEGACYIETANLDGETDLKAREALPETQELSIEAVREFKGIIECRPPNAEIYKFASSLRMSEDDDEKLSLSNKQCILQSTYVRHTDWVYGMVVYTGNESKLGMNKEAPPSKKTRLDRAVDMATVGIFGFQIVMIIIFGVLGTVWERNNGRRMRYLGYADDDPSYQPIVIPLRFLLLMSYMIPISLKVTLDVIKLYYSLLINWDEKMYEPATATYAHAHSTAISEDLGQVEYVFTDKTGTLTQNLMEFKKCSIVGVTYGHSPDSRDAMSDEALHSALDDSEETVDFFRCLALNHDVIPNKERNAHGELTYKGSSPDEEALVVAAQRLGVVFERREKDTLTLDVRGEEEVYERLCTLDFTSDRKRMSVVVRDREGNLTLYIKGADDKVLNDRVITDGQDDIIAATREHIEEFGELGLRTLVLGRRELSSEEYAAWAKEEKVARALVGDEREEALDALYDELETDLTILGCTAIEDKLQDKVPETIACLRQAGIKFWMLTGDKYSTAVEIAKSCNLHNKDGELLPVDGESSEEVAECIKAHTKAARNHALTGATVSVIIKGEPLALALAEDNSAAFLELALLCHTIICCRVTPKQKSKVVALVKRNDTVCLAIGDGGNDVAMIQEAHVGVGISGREGLQAARASDYSIGAFRFLKRLILVHGRQSYARTAAVAQYCFYKTLFLCLVQVWFNFFTGFSGSSLFNSFSLTAYNVTTTGLTTFMFVFDKDLSDSTVEAHPEVFRSGQTADAFNVRTFLLWCLNAIFQANVTLLFLTSVFGLNYLHWGDGSPADTDHMAMTGYTALLFVNQFMVMLELNTLNFIHAACFGLIFTGYFFMVTAYSMVSSLDFYTIMQRMYADANFWFCAALITIVCMIPAIIGKFLKITYWPTLAETLRRLDIANNKTVTYGESTTSGGDSSRGNRL